MTIYKRRVYISIAIAVCASCIVFASQSIEILQRNEWIAFDKLLSYKRKAITAPDEVVVILVDDASLQYMDPLVGRWPWPRSIFADVLDYVSLGNPQAIIFDMLFVEHQKDVPGASISNDARLIEASRAAGNVVHAMQFIHDNPDEDNSQLLNNPLPHEIVLKHQFQQNEQSTYSLPPNWSTNQQFNNYIVPIDGLHQSAYAVGVVSVEADSDGVLRRTPLFLEYQSLNFPALSIAALGKQTSQLNKPGVKQTTLDVNNIPLDQNGNYLVNFYPAFNTFSISGILSSIRSWHSGDVEKIIIYPDEFKDKFVFIGASAIGLHDLKNTPLGAKMPGVFLHASVLANVLRGDYLYPPKPEITWLSIILLSLFTSFGVLFFKLNTNKVLFPVTLVLLFAAWCYRQFDHNQIVAIVQPLLAITLTWALSYVYLLFTEGREKSKVRKMFSQYVSPAALAAMVDNFDEYKNAGIGSKETVTMLFSDIRGFTTLSELLPPEKVVEMLNYYFSKMTLAVHQHHGTIDKFIGDAIMATWGAPIKTENHASDAVHAALTMIENLKDVNAWLSEHNFEPIDIGIGIHTGDVILGSIGSDQKADYTVIGDNVNLASRLEGATKTYGCKLILSEATFQHLTNIPCLQIDIIRVKGKTKPIKIYTPLSTLVNSPLPGQTSQQQLQVDTQKALDAYLHQYWEDAIAQFQQLPNRKLGQLYISRCEQFQINPPPEDWDGVYTMHTK